MFTRLRPGLVPAVVVTTILAAAFIVPSVGASSPGSASLHSFLRVAYCTGVTLTPAPASPQPAGTQVTLTATSTCPSASPMYQFWARWAGTSTWVSLQAYGTSNTYVWNSTGASPGTENFGVWVKDATSTTTGFDNNVSIPFKVNSPCPGPTSISANPASVAAGVHSTFTGSTTCVHASPLYAFWLRTATSDWFLARAYSATATYDWNSTGAPVGTVYFGLWVKDAQSPTSTFDDNASTTVTVTAPPPPCTVPTVTPVPTTVVHGVGTHVVVTAASTCTNPSPKYQFWLRTTTSDWFVVQTYSTTPTYDWNSTGAPVTTVYIGVWVKDSASTATVDTFNSVAIPVT